MEDSRKKILLRAVDGVLAISMVIGVVLPLFFPLEGSAAAGSVAALAARIACALTKTDVPPEVR